ncbi:MAG: FeoB small GTPase domain-containing protein [Desulfosporosinus sp.]|jgi:Fe2+ transport system protein B
MGVNVTQSRVLREHFGITTKAEQMVIALAGNPNVGKSTVFNTLTGLRQHTGNWPGKTVDYAQGTYGYKNKSFLLVDLPGTYSILAHTVEEEIARDFICFGKPDVTVVVLDATALERNLNLALQVMEITSKVVVCVNLIDEAKKKKIKIDYTSLEKELGVPVVATAARQGEGLHDLKENIYLVACGMKEYTPRQIRYSKEVEDAVNKMVSKIAQLGLSSILNPRWIALRLLEGDEKLIDNISSHLDLQIQQSAIRQVEVAL